MNFHNKFNVSCQIFMPLDVLYVFQRELRGPEFEPLDLVISNEIQERWASFAKSRSPHSIMANAWPQFKISSEGNLEISDKSKSQKNLEPERLDLLDQVQIKDCDTL